MISSVFSLLRGSYWAVWLLSFYVFIWFLQIGNRIDFLGSIRIEFIIGTLLIFLSLKQWAGRDKHQPCSYSNFIKAIYFFYGILIVYTLFSMDRAVSWEVFSNRVVKFSMFTLFVGVLITNKAELKLVLLGFFLAMGKIIQEGVVGGFGGGLMWENQGILRLHGSTLMYRHPNSLSGLAVGALPFFLFLFRFQAPLIKLFFVAGIAGLLMIILYTGSRTGYVATSILFFAILLRVGLFKFKTIGTVFVVALCLVLFTPQGYKDRFGTMFAHGEARGSSTEKRIEILEDALAIAAKYPLGIGVSAFPSVRDMEFNRQQDTHNLYLEVWTNLGPFGFLAFVFFVATLFKTNIHTRKLLLAKDEQFLAELCYIVNMYILCRLALGIFGMDLYEVYWWFAAGLTIALAKLAVRSDI